jgi:RHS repeat-associated protein
MNGNLTDDGINIYQYDVLNRLRRVIRKTDNAVVATYNYDVLNRRVQRTVTNTSSFDDSVIYLHDGLHEIEERRDSFVQQYVYGGNSIDEPLTLDTFPLVLRPLPNTREGLSNENSSSNIDNLSTLFFHEDSSSNIVSLTDIAGITVEEYSYSAFGKPSFMDASGVVLNSSPYGNPLLFSGRRYDPETGFYYFRNRYLNPQEGRFITRDPLGIWSDSLNLGNGYAYVQNRPIDSADPLGLATCECPDCLECPIIECEDPPGDCSEYGWAWCQQHRCLCSICETGPTPPIGGGATPPGSVPTGCTSCGAATGTAPTTQPGAGTGKPGGQSRRYPSPGTPEYCIIGIREDQYWCKLDCSSYMKIGGGITAGVGAGLGTRATKIGNVLRLITLYTRGGGVSLEEDIALERTLAMGATRGGVYGVLLAIAIMAAQVANMYNSCLDKCDTVFERARDACYRAH